MHLPRADEPSPQSSVYKSLFFSAQRSSNLCERQVDIIASEEFGPEQHFAFLPSPTRNWDGRALPNFKVRAKSSHGGSSLISLLVR